MGLRSNVRMETLLFLLSSSLAFHSVSSSEFCHVAESSIILQDSQHFLVHTPESPLNFNVASEPCGLNENIKLDLDLVVQNSKHSQVGDISGMVWYEMSYSLPFDSFDSMLHVKVEAVPPYVYKRKVSHLTRSCLYMSPLKTFNVTFRGPVKIATVCSPQTESFPFIRAPGELRYDDDSNYDKKPGPISFKEWMDLFGADSNNNNGFDNGLNDDGVNDNGYRVNVFHDNGLHTMPPAILDLLNDINDNKITPPPYPYNRPSYTTPSYRYYGGHIIFLPIGAIIFLLSVGLRCCLCRRKKVVSQRVRTITVVRRIPLSPSSQEFISANEPTPENPLDLPPAYADIENEVPPPAYSELDTVHKMAPNNVGPSGEEDAHNTYTSPCNVSADTLTESSTTSTSTVPSAESSTASTSTSPSNVSADALTESSTASTSTVPLAESSTASTSTVPSAESVTEAVDMTAAEAVNGDLSGGESRSTLSRVLSAGSRSLKSQFSFKPMKEEEE